MRFKLFFSVYALSFLLLLFTPVRADDFPVDSPASSDAEFVIENYKLDNFSFDADYLAKYIYDVQNKLSPEAVDFYVPIDISPESGIVIINDTQEGSGITEEGPSK